MSAWVLGIGASHNGGACLLRDGELVVAIQQERLDRLKRSRLYPAFDTLAISYCLDAAGIDAGDVDVVAVTCDEPASRMELDVLRNPLFVDLAAPPAVVHVGHHRAHAAGACFQSGFDDAAVLVIDGLGSPYEDLRPDERVVAAEPGWETMSIYRMCDGVLDACVRKDLVADRTWLSRRPHGMPYFAGIGGMYSAVAQQLFGQYLEAGKVMGLAPHGEPTIPVDDFLATDGHQITFRGGVPERYPHDDRLPARWDEYVGLSASVQAALEHAVLWAVGIARELTGASRLVLAGGVALNCITNERIIRELPLDDVFIMPAAEDSGLCVGAAVAGAIDRGLAVPSARVARDSTGRAYSRADVESAVAAFPNQGHAANAMTASDVAEALAGGAKIGWFRGGSELGPRALGHRSILCDPRGATTQDELNDLKGRERFRPLAPIVLAPHARDWFDMGPEPLSPFMLRVCPVKEGRGTEIPAVTHVDGSARVQTLEREQNPELYAVIEAFGDLTGVPMLVNTSFNAAGEPIVESPEDALWCARRLRLDLLVAEGVGVAIEAELAPDAIAEAVDLLATAPIHHPAGAARVTVASPWGPVSYWLTAAETQLLQTLDGASLWVAEAVDAAGADVVESLRRKRLIRLMSASPAGAGDLAGSGARPALT